MIDPQGMGLRDWTDSMSFELERLSSGVPAVIEGDDWRGWARRAISLLIPTQQHAPDPDSFDTWQEFGERFSMYLGSNS